VRPLAFVTGAVGAGLGAGVLTALVIWIITVFTGSPGPWSLAPLLLGGAAGIVAVLTYVAELIVYRRTVERMRATGEPWAYRD
jgi:hypothetical protein